MRVLHYTLGFSPYRSGGLTKYAHDLMVAQIELGHNVTALYPGDMRLFCRKTKIVKDKNMDGIIVYELRNPLPVPLLYGLSKNDAFIDDCVVDEDDFRMFVNKIQPEVLHIHTLMGLPKRIIEIAKECGLKIVYTTHDYFGLCLKVNFINDKGYLCDGASSERCLLCNTKSKGLFFLRLRNSKLLLHFKNILRRIY